MVLNLGYPYIRRHFIKFNAFHRRCIRSILGITNRQQWVQSITSCDIRQRWGDLETIEDKLIKRGLEWLGHLARMSNKRIPKSALFGWLTQPRPRCGPKKRWRDAVRQDLKTISVGENNWHSEVNESREVWRALYKLGVEDHVKSRCTDRQSTQANYGVFCDICKRSFRREGNKKRHKCTAERKKPIV